MTGPASLVESMVAGNVIEPAGMVIPLTRFTIGLGMMCGRRVTFKVGTATINYSPTHTHTTYSHTHTHTHTHMNMGTCRDIVANEDTWDGPWGQ